MENLFTIAWNTHLLYLVINDHPFIDDNKRCGAFLFMLYIQEEDIAHQLSAQALTALALLVAESQPASKDLMIRLILTLLEAGAGEGGRLQ